MGERIRTGIIGLGRSGWNIHADALADHAAFEVAAVADPLADRLQEAQERFGCAVYETPEQLIQDPSLELIVVASPSHLHVPQAKAAMEAGKHVVVEKPMAQTTAEIDMLIEVAQKTGKVVTCYQPRRLDADFLTIKEWLDSGRLGRIISMRSGIYRYQRRADWQMLRKYGGGELSNTAVHTLDQLLLFMGPDAKLIYADLRRTVGAGDAEDHVKLLLKNDDGCVGEIEVSNAVALPLPSWTIVGTTGTLIYQNGEMTAKWYDPSLVPPLQLDEGAVPGRLYGSDKEIPWQRQTWKPTVPAPQAQAFYDYLEATIRRGAPVFVTPESIRAQIAIVQQARQMAGLL